LPEIVGDDEVVTANSAPWSAAVIGQIALAPTAGMVITRFGVEAAFAVNAATFVVSALLVTGMRSGRMPAEVIATGWAGVLGGVRAVRGSPLLVRLAVVQVLASMSAGATGGLLVVLAERWIGVGPTGFGALLAPSASAPPQDRCCSDGSCALGIAAGCSDRSQSAAASTSPWPPRRRRSGEPSTASTTACSTCCAQREPRPVRGCGPPARRPTRSCSTSTRRWSRSTPNTGPVRRRTSSAGSGSTRCSVFLDATGEALAGVLRPGNAVANSGADQLAVAEMATAQLPAEHRQGHAPGDHSDAVAHPILVRADSAGAVRAHRPQL